MSTISPSSRRGQQIAKREHVRAEAQLKIHRGDETELAADGDDRSCRGEIFAHRLLNEHGRAARQLFQHAGDLIARHRHVEHGIRQRRRLRRATENTVDTPNRLAVSRDASRIDVVEARDGKLQPLVHGQVRRAHDAAGADDDDRARPRRHGPRLPEMRHRSGFRTCATDRRRGQWPAPPLYPDSDERPAPWRPTTRPRAPLLQAPGATSSGVPIRRLVGLDDACASNAVR